MILHRDHENGLDVVGVCAEGAQSDEEGNHGQRAQTSDVCHSETSKVRFAAYAGTRFKSGKDDPKDQPATRVSIAGAFCGMMTTVLRVEDYDRGSFSGAMRNVQVRRRCFR